MSGRKFQIGDLIKMKLKFISGIWVDIILNHNNRFVVTDLVPLFPGEVYSITVSLPESVSINIVDDYNSYWPEDLFEKI